MILISRVLLRWSWGLLFIWFGSQQLFHPAEWVTFLPVWTGYLPIPGEMLIQLNGWFEVCAATLILVGYFTRFCSVLLATHLLGIALTVGGAIGVRDAVLAVVGFSLALGEKDAFMLETKFP